MSLSVTRMSMYILELVLCLSVSSLASDITPESSLLGELMVNYSKNIRPVYNITAPMIVAVQFQLNTIEELQEKNQVLVSRGQVFMKWTDEVLRWKPEDHNGIDHLVLPSTMIWLPELAIYNSVERGNDLTQDVLTRVFIRHTGQVTFTPSFIWNTHCRVNLKYFPYDKQVCNVSFVEWGYHLDTVTFQNDGVVPSDFEENEGWSLLQLLTGQDSIRLYEGGSVIIPKIYFTVQLQRRPWYYISYVVLPAMLISIMTFLVFLLPTEASEKISLGVTVTLSYTVVLLMVSDITPINGESVPYITTYIMVNMSQTTLSLVITILLMNWHYHTPDKPVPAWLTTYCTDTLAIILRMRNELDDHPEFSKTSHGYDELGNEPPASGDKDDPKNSDQKRDNNVFIFTDEVMNHLRYLSAFVRDRDRREHNSREWHNLGKVIDRFLMYHFVFMTVLEILYFLCVVNWS